MDQAYAKTKNLSALLKLAAPIAVSQIAQTSMGFVDTVMVGRLGPTDLAAVSLGSATFFGVLVFALGILVGVGPIVAQADGAGDSVDTGRTARHGIIMAGLLTPVVVLLIFGARAFIPSFIDDPAVANLAQGYLSTVSWSVFPFLGFVATRSWLEALNRPLVVTVFALLTVGINVFGNYAFVYGAFGLPQLGAVGTGYATSLSNAFLFFGLMLYAYLQPELRHSGVFSFRDGTSKKKLAEILKVGGPIGISFGIEVGLFSATAILMGGLGAVSLAAHQIAIQLASLTFMLPLSVALAVTVRVGNLVGAGHGASARHAGWLAVAIGTGLMTISATLFVVSPDPLISIFLGNAADMDDEGVKQTAILAAELLVLAGAFQLFDGLQATAAGALRGLKDTFAPMLIGFVCYWLIGLTTGHFLAKTYGAHGLWAGLVIGLAAAGVFLNLRWWRLSRRL